MSKIPLINISNGHEIEKQIPGLVSPIPTKYKSVVSPASRIIRGIDKIIFPDISDDIKDIMNKLIDK